MKKGILLAAPSLTLTKQPLEQAYPLFHWPDLSVFQETQTRVAIWARYRPGIGSTIAKAVPTYGHISFR